MVKVASNLHFSVCELMKENVLGCSSTVYTVRWLALTSGITDVLDKGNDRKSVAWDFIKIAIVKTHSTMFGKCRGGFDSFSSSSSIRLSFHCSRLICHVPSAKVTIGWRGVPKQFKSISQVFQSAASELGLPTIRVSTRVVPVTSYRERLAPLSSLLEKLRRATTGF